MAEDYNEELEIIDNSVSHGGGYFEIYFRNKMGREFNGNDVNIENSYIFKEFMAKAQFFQHTLGLGKVKEGFQIGLLFACNSNAKNFSKETSKEIFDNFLHFIFANDRDFDFLKNLIEEWIKEDRSLTDIQNIDGSPLTPLNIAILHNNISAFTLLVQNKVDVTEWDNDGFAPIHRIISKIDNKTMGIDILELWIKNGLPIDTKDKYGNDALVYAKKFELQEIIELLESNDQIIEDSLKLKKEIEEKFDKNEKNKESLTPSEKIKLLLELIKQKASDDDIKLKFGIEGNHFSNLAKTIQNNPKVLESLLTRHKIKVADSNEDSEIFNCDNIELSNDIGTSLTGSLEEDMV